MQKKVKTPEQALQSLMALCAKAERSSGDALRLMARWGVDPEKRPVVLEQLQRGRFIDDRRYAEAFVREKSNLNGWGIHKIRPALAAKGIARPVIDQATEQLNPETAQEKLETLLARRARTIKAANAYDLRGKLIRYGLSRGFEYEQVVACVENMIRATDEE